MSESDCCKEMRLYRYDGSVLKRHEFTGHHQEVMTSELKMSGCQCTKSGSHAVEEVNPISSNYN